MSKPSLSKKLSRTLMLLAFPVLAVSMWSYYNHTQELIHNEALERSTSILNTTMQRVVRYMDAVETAAKSNVWLLEANFDPDSMYNISRRIVSLNPSVISCSVSAEPGTFPQVGRYYSVYSVNEGDTIISMVEPDYEYFEKAWYRTAMETGKPSWVDPFTDFNEGTINYNEAVASYSIPLRPNGRQIQGVVSTDFSFARLTENILNAAHPYPSAYYVLIGNNGRYLVHPDTKLLFKKTIFSVTDSLEHADIITLGREMTAGHKGTMHVNIDDKRCHVSYAPVPDTNWSLALICHDDEVLADYRYLAYLMAGLLLVGLVLIWWLTDRVVRMNIQPVNQLLDMTKKIAKGHYDEKIPRTNRKDVVAKLQNSFSAMQQAIMRHMEDIDHTTEELKQQNDELAEAVKKASEAATRKEHFMQNVTRQITTPINIINGLASVLHQSIASQGNNKPVELSGNITRTMKRNALQLNRIMLMLYDSSDTGTADMSIYARTDIVACNTIARECIGYMHDYFPDSEARLESEMPDNQSIYTNHLYVARTLRELLFNAAKYSDGQHITMRIAQTATTVLFTVEDVGPGLSEDYQNLLHLPFTKAEEQSEGLGLGLPLSMRHAAGLGGQLIYDADYREGCRITVELPK